MECEKCHKDFPEHLIESSHDVPCYLFEGRTRQEKKPKADQFPRHWLCKKCHKDYENGLRLSLKIRATQFSNKFFECDDVKRI